MKKVLFYADTYNGSSGYSKVVREFSKRLAASGYQVYVQEVVTSGMIWKDKNGVIILPANAPRGSEAFLFNVTNNIISYSPDYFIPVCDAFLMTMDGLNKLIFKNVKMIPYSMVDANELPDLSKATLDNASYVMTAAMHSKKIHEEEGYETYLLHHGVNTDIYKAADKRTKKLLRLKKGIKEYQKIFLSVGRNQPRKNLYALVEAYAIFSKNNENQKSLLYIHGSELRNNTRNIEEFIKRMEKKYNIELNITLSKEHKLGEGLNEQEMIELFQMSDFYISASNGEGFGLPIIEAMACELPVIHPRNSVADELIGDRGYLAEPKGLFYAGFGVTQPLTDPYSLAEQIEKAYKDSSENRNKIITNAKNWVIKECDWNKLTISLKNILEDN